MAHLGIVEAFGRYGATLRNPQWSVSAWAPDGSLVVSLWDHHYRKGPPGGVAKHSLHLDGKAIDIRIPGRDLAQLRDGALSLKGGGGFYPKSQFVHLDTGRVRRWEDDRPVVLKRDSLVGFICRAQLAHSGVDRG